MWDDLTCEFDNAGIRSRRQASLAEYTTFKLGGACPLLVECETADQVCRVVECLVRRLVPFVFIGGGSNLLVSDAGLEEVVVRYVAREPAIQLQGTQVRVSGGTSLDDLAAFCVDHGLGQIVKTSGIPGTVGGAIIGNAGAFGWQIADALIAVQLLDRRGKQRLASAAELGFAYRDSLLKQTREIVLEATLELPMEEPGALRNERAEILGLRASKHPDLIVDCCAGSFFRNIEPTSKAERRQAAGWFLEQAGAKDMQVGGARVFSRHANIIVKGNSECRSQDVLALSLQMAEAVRVRFGLELTREVQLLGNFIA